MRAREISIAGNPVIVIDIDQEPPGDWCPTCGEGCCQLAYNGDDDPICPGGCEHGEIHYLEQFRVEVMA